MMMSNINQTSYRSYTTSIVHFHHFGIFVWMGETIIICYMWMCIFLKMKKKIFILKNIRMSVDRALPTAFLGAGN